MQSFVKLVVTVLISFATIGCKEESKASTFRHPELGVVSEDHPKYIEAYNLCDGRVYGNGFEINGKIYTSKAEVFEQIRPMLSKLNKSKSELDIMARWAGEAQPKFIRCMTEQGFVLVKPED